MKVSVDTSGFDDMLEAIDDAALERLKEIGREAIQIAYEKRVTSGLKTYINRTGNLHNAPGACIVKNGKIVWIEIMADSAHPEAEDNTRNLLIYSEHPNDGLYIADGMKYASFVNSKGYDVLDSAYLHARKLIEED